MAMSQAFREQYLDPRWQKLRLQLFSEAKWECERCGDSTSTLHAHHRKYKPRAKVWEYDTCELECLCEMCHAMEHGKPHQRIAHYMEWQAIMGYHFAVLAQATDAGETLGSEQIEQRVRRLMARDGLSHGQSA